MSRDSVVAPVPLDNLRFGGFVIQTDANGRPRVLGEGTFGRTYLAQHQYLDTLAALKIITERFATERSARERFLSEGRALVRLDHRHIARLHDFGEADGALFYAMEYCQGGDLSELVKKKGALTLPDWMLIAQQLASALECCHAASFIHRDLKPSNVMLARSEGPIFTKLIDFGLVQIEGPDAEATARMVGTPLYASPEQLRAEPIDARSDLFSLGMTLWHLAQGTPPEKGGASSIIASRLNGESYAPAVQLPLPGPLRDLVARLVEKDRSRRVSSATEVIRLLAQAAQTLQLPLPPGFDPAHLAAVSVASSPAAGPDPLAVEEIDAPLQEEFEVTDAACEQNTGINYLATRRTSPGGRVLLHSLHPQVVEDEALLGKLRSTAAQLQAHQLPFSLLPRALRSYRDFTVLVLDPPTGEPLGNALKRRGKCPIGDAMPLLERIAAAADAHAGSGLPGVELAPGRIYLKPPGLSGPGSGWEPELLPRLLLARETLDLARDAAEQDPAETTMSGELFEDQGAADDAPRQFARLIYRVAAGRECSAAAGLSTRAYVAVPELSEGTNRLLSHAIAGQATPATCAALLSEVLAGEGAGGGASTRSASRSVLFSAAATVTDAAHLVQTAAPQPAPTARIRPAPPQMTATLPPMATASTMPPPLPAATASATLPPVAPPSPATAAVGGPARKGWSPAMAGVVGAAVMAVIGVALLFMLRLPSSKPSAEENGRVASLPANGGDALPANTVVALVGDFPQGCRVTVGGTPVQGKQEAGLLEVPVGGKSLPIEIRVSAQGYRDAVREIASRDALKTPQPLSFERARGTLVFTRRGPIDYSNAVARMYETLPDEQNLVPLERVTRSQELRSTGEERLELPTGRWVIALQSGNGRTIRTREFQRVDIEADREHPCVLPPSFAGTYRGKLRDANGAVDATLTIEPGLTDGEYSDTRGGVARRVRLESCRLDGTGTFTALARFSHSLESTGFDEQITATISDSGNEVSVKLMETVLGDDSARKPLDRAPFSEKEWSRTGTLTRGR